MTQPDELKSTQPLKWSTGRGVDVWAMFQAAIAGDVAQLRELLMRDPSLVRSQYAYRTPLYFAVRENQIAAAKFLIESGADPSDLCEVARDRGYKEMAAMLEGESPKSNAIAEAIRARDAAKVRSLLDASPELLHAGDQLSNQPIHWAVMTRQIDVIDELLSRGADLEARRTDGARPIHLTNGDYRYRGWRDVPKEITTTPGEVLAHLIARGANVDIWIASVLGNLDRVRELLDQDPSLANRNCEYSSYYLGSGSALKNAAAKGHMEIVKLLLDRGADPNLPEEHIAPQGHALYSAVYNGHYEIAKLLLERGAYANAPVESSGDALSIALGNEDEAMVELLCSYGAARSVEILGYYGDVQTAAAVFAANPTLADDAHALITAASEGQEAFIRLMLRYYPDLPTRITQLPCGRGPKTRVIAELLFAHGMNPNQRDWLGGTPLHELARKGDLENAALFLDHGADINAVDENTQLTPLGIAKKFGQTEMVKLLTAKDDLLGGEHLRGEPQEQGDQG